VRSKVRPTAGAIECLPPLIWLSVQRTGMSAVKVCAWLLPTMRDDTARLDCSVYAASGVISDGCLVHVSENGVKEKAEHHLWWRSAEVVIAYVACLAADGRKSVCVSLGFALEVSGACLSSVSLSCCVL